MVYTLVIREHSSKSVVSNMRLYYAQYKHTKFRRRSCLGINQLNSPLTLFVFWFSNTFCSKFCFNFSHGLLKYCILVGHVLVKELHYFFETALIDQLSFGYFLWNSCHLLLFLLIGEQCLTWKFHFVITS